MATFSQKIKKNNKGWARREKITGVVGVESTYLHIRCLCSALFSFSVKPHVETQSEGWKQSFPSNCSWNTWLGETMLQRAGINIWDQSTQSNFSPQNQDHPTKENKMNKPTVVYPDDCTDRCQTRKTTIHCFVRQNSVTVHADMGSTN